MFSVQEKNTMGVLSEFLMENPKATLQMAFEDKIIEEAQWDTTYETDNGLELSDPDYDEFYAMAFNDLQTGQLFEISYRNFPSKIICNDQIIYNHT